jgi:phenylalanyl-tRNA synthetase beta chain
MRISLNWLKDYVDLDLEPNALAARMTMLGLEIEGIEAPGAGITRLVVGQIESIEPHPNADKVVVCKTRVGEGEPLQIICGAKNMSVGDKVPTALVGATLPGGFEISQRKMRGVESFGMMCAADELGLGDDHSGLIILDPSLPVGIDAKPILGLDDVIFEIEVIPNRGDWASMIGVARELAALLGKEVRLPEAHVSETGPAVDALSSVTNDAPALCPRYLGRLIEGVKIGPSPQWLCNRLTAAGMRPINNVVDVTNYVLLETGHPLHAFDRDLLDEHRIVVRQAAEGEKMKTLDGQERTLASSMLVIADATRVQALAGIMGGEHSEVGESTVNLFLESAWFDPISVRRTARNQAIVTESSQRFQRGADPEMAAFAIDRAARLIQELAGGAVAKGRLDSYPKPMERRIVRLRHARANAVLGVEVPVAAQCQYLERLGFEPATQDAAGAEYLVPTWRHDVTLEADLIEEIARLHGYENIPATLPRIRPVEQRFAPQHAALRALRNHLAGQGLTEVYHWTFGSTEDLERAGIGDASTPMVRLQNPLSERHAAMRISLVPALLNHVAHNLNRGARAIASFELGPVYQPREGADLPGQRTALGIALTGKASAQHWSEPEREADFYDIKGIAENLAAYFQKRLTLNPLDAAPFQQGQAAALSLDGASLMRIGKVDPAIAKRFGIDPAQAVYLLELDVEPLLRSEAKPALFAPVPAYPPSLRDLAVVVDREVPAAALLATAQKAAGTMVKSVAIFDVYTGKQVPEGKKSIALGLVFQSHERTLTDKDTQKTMDKILRSLEVNHQAVLR